MKARGKEADKTTSSTRGLFLDLDGTIADSLSVLRQVFHEFLSTHGIKSSEEEFSQAIGPPISEGLLRLKKYRGISMSRHQFLAGYWELLESRYLQQARLMPGARELLKAAADRGIWTAVVTSSQAALATKFLDQQGVLPYINQVAGVEMIKRGKPDPEPYLLALQSAGIKPQEGLAVEDSPAGAASALAAGLTTYVMAPNGRRLEGVTGIAGYIHSLDDLIPRLEN